MIIVRCCRFIVTLSVCLWIAPSVQFALRSRVVVCSIIYVVVASFSPLSSLRGEMALLAFLVVGLFCVTSATEAASAAEARQEAAAPAAGGV